MLRDSGQVGDADEVPRPLPEASKGQNSLADKAITGIPLLANNLAELQVSRLFYIRAQQRLTLSAKSLARRSLGFNPNNKDEKLNARAGRIVDAALSGKEAKQEDAAVAGHLAADLAVIASAGAPLSAARKQIEKEMKRLAKSLPVYPWAKDVKGLGELGLAVIVGEAGDLAKYPKKGHLWKRLGLAPFEGKALSTWRGIKGGLTADQWIEAGYKPTRRAEIHACVSDPLFRAQSVSKGPYRAIYDRRRAATSLLHQDWTPMHSHMDGMRVMTKYLIRDLWKAWPGD